MVYICFPSHTAYEFKWLTELNFKSKLTCTREVYESWPYSQSVSQSVIMNFLRNEEWRSADVSTQPDIRRTVDRLLCHTTLVSPSLSFHEPTVWIKLLIFIFLSKNISIIAYHIILSTYGKICFNLDLFNQIGVTGDNAMFITLLMPIMIEFKNKQAVNTENLLLFLPW